jgi:tetratricopeptide (TPR) repeat protein
MTALLTACVSLPTGSPTAKSSASPASASADAGTDPSDQSAAASVGGGNVSMAVPVVPVPEIRGSTAADFEAAVAHIQAERYREAEVILLGITGDQPELAGPWINLGQVYVALEQPEEARRAFEAAVAANPYNCTAYNELGLLARQNGDFEAAEQHYLSCLEHVPGNDTAHLNLGILYELYLGRLPEALANYRQYQALQDEEDRRVKGWVMDLERRLGV